MGRGYSGLLGYRTSRSRANQSNKRLGDCFHDGKTILPTVFEWHNSLKSVLRTCDPTTPKVLQMIEEHILLEEPDSRLDTKQLWHRAKSLIDSGKASTSSGFSHGLGQPGPSNVPSPPLPPASRYPPNTPTKRSNRYHSIAKSNRNQASFILSDLEVEEPDNMSTYGGTDHFPLEHGRTNLGTVEHWDRTMSQPGHPVERPNVPLFLSENRINGPPVEGPLESNRLAGVHPHQTNWAGQAFLNSTSRPGKNRWDTSGPSQTRQSTSATYHRDGAAADRYDPNSPLEGIEDDERSHRRGPSAASAINKTQSRHPGWSPSQDEFQTHDHDPGSRPTSNSSSPPAPHRPHSVAGKKDNGKASIKPQNKATVASTAKMRATKKLPVLSISAAIEWKRAKKENESFFKKFWKREEPELEGQWLLSSRVGKRDHVRLNP